MIRASARAAFAVGLVSVAVFSLLPPEAGIEVGASDKLQHAAAYAAIGACGAVGYRGWRAGVVLAMTLAAIGAGLEGLQALIPGRMPEAGDALANLAGAVPGVFLAVAADRSFARHRSG